MRTSWPRRSPARRSRRYSSRPRSSRAGFAVRRPSWGGDVALTDALLEAAGGLRALAGSALNFAAAAEDAAPRLGSYILTFGAASFDPSLGAFNTRLAVLAGFNTQRGAAP